MAVLPDSVAGIITTADPTMIVGLADVMKERGLTGEWSMAIKYITLFNPASSAAPFILRKRVLDENGGQRFIRRKDKSMPATDDWSFGQFGGIMVLSHVEHWYEVVMDSAPVSPIEYCVDFGLTR